jgi:hypothetical protein
VHHNATTSQALHASAFRGQEEEFFVILSEVPALSEAEGKNLALAPESLVVLLGPFAAFRTTDE